MEKLLIFAVPMWIEKLRWSTFAEFERRRDSILESVCYKGDLLLFGSPKKGETAKLFNDLAEGLAWLALIAKGGVTFGEQHWDAEFLSEDEKMFILRKESEGRAFKQEAVLPVCGNAKGATTDNHEPSADCSGENNDR